MDQNENMQARLNEHVRSVADAAKLPGNLNRNEIMRVANNIDLTITGSSKILDREE
jgi:hypothetical protein